MLEISLPSPNHFSRPKSPPFHTLHASPDTPPPEFELSARLPLRRPYSTSALSSLAKDTVIFRQPPAKPAATETPTIQPTNPIPDLLRHNIETGVIQVFGPEQAGPVSKRIFEIIRNIQKARPPELLKQDFDRKPDWYKDEVVYMMYPERFGVKEDGKPNTFRDLIPMLGYLKDLGATTLYILPPFESPMIDAGFDISNYKKIRKELGGNEQFREFLAEARKLGLKIKLDLVLNHVSDQHPWAKKALSGDPKKLNYFLIKDKLPAYELEDDGKTAVYHEDDGTLSKRAIIFPEISRGHYRKAAIPHETGTKEKFLYHTFYPHQLDVNHQNPEVLYKFLKVMGHWANQGVDIFRLDAAPFYVKTPGTNGQGTPETHAVIQILSSALQAMSPRSVLWAEACQSPTDLRPFYGEDHHYEHPIPDHGKKAMARTNKVQIAYHFPQMVALWATMLSQSPEAFWKIAEDTPPLPETAQWSIFHSVHDEKTPEACPDPNVRRMVYDGLVRHGEPFREGQGVSGRLADFMENDPRRIKLMNAIMFSLPGIPIVYYGDEIGERNNHSYMEQSARERELHARTSGATVSSFLDSRDVHRAPISRERLQQAASNPDTPEGQIHDAVKNFIAIHKQETALTHGGIRKVPASQPNTFSYLREAKDNRILMAHNLSDKPITTVLQLPPDVPVSRFPSKGILDLQTQARVPFRANPETNCIELALEPYQSLWLKPDADDTSTS